jgi:ABC-type multidrug transport system fused ATPase/permease subunit
LIKKPRVLLLDEVTAGGLYLLCQPTNVILVALDSQSEQAVLKALDSYCQKTKATRIIITHHLKTITNADLIVVIQGGKIVEQGTHKVMTFFDSKDWLMFFRIFWLKTEFIQMFIFCLMI